MREYTTWHYTSDSSSIWCLLYNENTRELGVSFRSNSNKVYVYNDVSPHMWWQFKNADSAGKFYADRIKEHYHSAGQFDLYTFTKVEANFNSRNYEVTYEVIETVDAKDYHEILDKFKDKVIVRIEKVD